MPLSSAAPATHQRSDAGFSAVELLITLFVAATFLVAGYQLFNAIINDGGDTRAESRASNIAYEYLRDYSSSAQNPCTAITPLDNQTISVAELSNVTVTVSISCPTPDALAVSKVEATVRYNVPQQTVRHATFIDMSKGTPL